MKKNLNTPNTAAIILAAGAGTRAQQKNEKKQFLLLHSNSEKVMDYWAKDAINNINKQIIFDNFTGCYNENYTNPINAIFNILDKIINLDDLWGDENPSLTFYYFTNSLIK